jgi:hypothetical protein
MLTQKPFIAWLFCLAMLLSSGCVEPPQYKQRVFLTVDFQPSQTLRYKFTSDRKIDTDWAPGKKNSKSIKSSTESVEMMVAYEPIEVNPYGLTKIKATFESVKAKKTGTPGHSKDAVETLQGKSYTFTVGPDGKIHDRSELIALLKEASKVAFGAGNRASIKQPDLLDDVLASQWYLWDSISSIPQPALGLKIGQTWKSQMLIPTSMVLRTARDVTYQLTEVRRADTGPVAVIDSTYTLSAARADVPYPYAVRSFQLAGAFGFFQAMFKGLSFTGLEGNGHEMFDIDAGRILSSEQNYTATVKPNASPLAGANPVIYLEQKITMQLLGPGPSGGKP